MKRAALAMVAGLALVGGGTLATARVAPAAEPKVPTIEWFTLEHGPLVGGTTADIVGNTLDDVVTVPFGSTPFALIMPVHQNEILALSPPGVGTVDVTMTTAGDEHHRVR